ncbi:hypothetical protein UCREL1_8954 [Eutypa lata UCREL1]|uniref:Uncharacterized protein n=1 Tax=Eutypa lata (strain UCR-EL1) TaxID=1287681 RepID=M7T2N7_EUTLA|nr:hypothetical protein UCREL1_8954 [Eutypa lata UCREL1]
MPKFRHDAPACIPDAETLDSLLGVTCDRKPDIKTIHMLDESEKKRTGLSTVLKPIFSELIATEFTPSQALIRISNMLARVPQDDMNIIAKEESEHHEYEVVAENDEEVTICFRLGDRRVRLMQALDIDMKDSDSYTDCSRSKRCEERAADLVQESRMPIDVQQYLMAKILKNAPMPELSKKKQEGFFHSLRSSAQQQYWMEMSAYERKEVRQLAAQKHEDLETQLVLYVTDECAAKQVLQLVDEDIFIVTDANRRVIFANFEKLCQAMFDQEVADLLARAYDMWSFFVALPYPESKRHVVDNWVRKIHPELDPERATVGDLPVAKMAIAHYGCWSMQTDPYGEFVIRTADSRCGQIIRQVEYSKPLAYMTMFQKAVLGKASELIRFLIASLDPDLYSQYCEVWDNMPDDQRITTNERDFLTLFAVGINGYTQRHRDDHDFFKGMAGLCTFGDYVDHYIEDYSGPRFFTIGTHHESSRRSAWRKLGRVGSECKEEKRKEEVMREIPPCVNTWYDKDDLEWTNEELHGPAALPLYGSGTTTSGEL